MPMMPWVSIVIPTYMREQRFLGRAIESALSQTYPKTEVVVVDDNEPNTVHRKRTIALMEAYRCRENLVYVQNEKNLGGAIARNRGISIAKGDYITFLDDDDMYLPVKVERQVAFMIEQNCDMSFSDIMDYNEQERLVDVRTYNISDFSQRNLLRYHLMHHLTGTPSFMYRAETLRRIGGFPDVKMGQEFHLMLRTIESGASIRYFPECNRRGYIHNGVRISNGQNKIDGENALYEFKKRYYQQLDIRARRFVTFRHYAVLAVAFYRSGQYALSLLSLMRSFLSSPLDLVTQVVIHAVKMTKASVSA